MGEIEEDKKTNSPESRHMWKKPKKTVRNEHFFLKMLCSIHSETQTDNIAGIFVGCSDGVFSSLLFSFFVSVCALLTKPLHLFSKYISLLGSVFRCPCFSSHFPLNRFEVCIQFIVLLLLLLLCYFTFASFYFHFVFNHKQLRFSSYFHL